MLLKKFGELKEQALPARLYGVQPVNHIWSHAARKKFLELTDSRPLSAHVSDIEQEVNNWLIFFKYCLVHDLSKTYLFNDIIM